MPERNTSIPDNVMHDAVSAVLSVRLDGDETEQSTLEIVIDGSQPTRMEDLGVDSLIVSEIIVELEERLDVLLELNPNATPETFGELRAALQPVGES